MAEHSPKPWHNAEHFTDGKHDGHLIVDADGYNVANIWHAKHLATPERIAVQDANACLVTAAPKMLEALRTLYQDADDRDETRDEETGELFDDWAAALEAINEATGISPPATGDRLTELREARDVWVKNDGGDDDEQDRTAAEWAREFPDDAAELAELEGPAS